VISLRTLLALSRAASLPTVWSNCLAGWWLSGGGNTDNLPLLFMGATSLFLSAVFLNDAWDEGYDRQFRRIRPIPSGAVATAVVLRWAVIWLLAGEACLFAVSRTAGVLGVALALCAALYNAIHRLITFSPVLLGLCRLLLYLIAGSAAANGVSGWSIWCGLALALYLLGAGCLPRPENTRGPSDFWPLVLLGTPVLLALLMDPGPYQLPAAELSAILGLWVVYCLRYAYWPADRNFARATSGLVSGIVLVDWLAVVDVPRELSLVFLGLFGATLLLQRLVPAS
jgi:hypothetical protein